jgi:PAS domain S-box-containing protein
MDRQVFFDCNHKTELMFGSARDQILGHSPADLSPAFQPDGSPSAETMYTRIDAALSGEPQFFEWMHHRRDGTPFTAEVGLNRVMLRDTYYLQAIVQDITERKKAEESFQKVTKKLSLLNSVTFNDIRNAVFSLNGYLALENEDTGTTPRQKYREQEEDSIRKISDALNFAKDYQDLGASPPRWQNVQQSFLLGISHLDFSSVQRSVQLENLEIYADPLLERVFLTFADNIIKHAKGASQVSVGYQSAGEGIMIFFRDNGPGIPDARKEKIFERGSGTRKGMQLFLVREILGITGISLAETGTPGKGACFTLSVPKGAFRFSGKKSA